MPEVIIVRVSMYTLKSRVSIHEIFHSSDHVLLFLFPKDNIEKSQIYIVCGKEIYIHFLLTLPTTIRLLVIWYASFMRLRIFENKIVNRKTNNIANVQVVSFHCKRKEKRWGLQRQTL